MAKIKSEKELVQIKDNFDTAMARYHRRVMLCAGTGCVANGSLKVHQKLVETLKAKGLTVHTEVQPNAPEDAILVSTSGCQGFCQMGPLVAVEPDGLLYTKVKIDDVEDISQKTIIEHEIIDRLLYALPGNETQHCKGCHEIPFYALQERTVLEACGQIDAEDIREYISHNGYKAVQDLVLNHSAEQTCKTVIDSGLRGRGGGGFLTGRKWEFTRIEKSKQKVVICNGDEGDPGAFMDRSVLEGTPHSVIEGMMICGHAIGATEGHIYVRMEYPLAVARVRKAVTDAENLGLLGNNIFGTGWSFHIHVMEGAGAFVCGEETALMSSIEGKRGMPMPKPPYPAQSGLNGLPTVINNVETLAMVPLIFQRGVESFRNVGTQKSPGTKTFALTGHVANTGLIEVPFGTTLRKIIFDIGGGVTNAQGEIDPSAFKAVQIGGPSGGCLTKEHLDLPVDFDSLLEIGAMVGSGGLVVMNQDTCMVKIARFFMQFTQNESCGKCVLCREGTQQMLALLDDIIEGRGTLQTLDLLVELGEAVKKGSLCGLGKTAPNPVLSTLRQFREEYEAHVIEKHCPTRQCKALVKPQIETDLCKGCGLCAKKCPVGAISGQPRQPYVIDEAVCISCGACIETCKFNAIA